MKKYIMRREGEFDIVLAEGNVCGLSGSLDFRYEFTVTSSKLDERGFVADHHEVVESINRWVKSGTFRGSCEKLATAIALIVRAHIHVYEPGATINMKLSGSKVADITILASVQELDLLKQSDKFSLVTGENLFPLAVHDERANPGEIKLVKKTKKAVAPV